MRLIVCCGGFPSVSETFVSSQVIGLERLGHRVTVVAEELDADLLSRLPPGVPSGGIFSLGREGRHPLSGLRSKIHLLTDALPAFPAFVTGEIPVARFLGKGLRWTAMLSALAHRQAGTIPRADLVHAHFGPTGLWARALAVRQEIPLTVTFHGYDATSFPSELGWGAYRPLLDGRAATLIAHSPFIAGRLRRGLGVEPFTIPLGVDTRLFAPGEGARPPRKDRDGPRLAFVGNLTRQKGIRVALEALALLRGGWCGERLRATLDVVGKGPETALAKGLAETLGISDSVRMHGPRPPEGVASVLRGSDLLLVPSSPDLSGAEEGFGLVSLEAQACGALVVGTDCGGLPAAVAPPAGGRCVPAQSPSAMAAAVWELWSRPDLEELGIAARKRILELHTADIGLRAYERIFEGLVAGRGGREGRAQKGPGPAPPARWDHLEAALPPRGEVLGSLVAYTSGKDVLEVRRLPRGRPPGDAGAARSWVQAGPGEAARSDDRARDRFDVLLDLDGTSPERMVRDSLSCGPALRPGGMAILAVHLEDSGVSSFCERLRGSFRQVLPLDRLFAPGPALPGEGPVRGRTPGDSGAPSSNLRYVLCRP